MNRYFTKSGIINDNKYMNIYLTGYIIRKLQNKTIRYHYTLIRVTPNLKY